MPSLTFQPVLSELVVYDLLRWMTTCRADECKDCATCKAGNQTFEDCYHDWLYFYAKRHYDIAAIAGEI